MAGPSVAERVTKIIGTQMGLDQDKISPEAGMIDLYADSLDVMEAVMELEDEFDINIPDEDHEGWRTVGDVIKYVEGKV